MTRGNAATREEPFSGFLFHANHFAHRANENFRAPGHFGGQSESNVELRSWTQILVNREVDAACGNVACLTVARGYLFVNRHPIITGKDKSYRRAVLRSVIFLPRTPSCTDLTHPLTKKWEHLKFQSGRVFHITVEPPTDNQKRTGL